MNFSEEMRKLVKYCGSGIMPYHDPSQRSSHHDDHRTPATAPDTTVPEGYRISLVPNYQPTPAERAGIREGDVITHALTTTGPRPVYGYGDVLRYALGPVGSTQSFLVHTPGEASPREVTLRKSWIVYLGSDHALRSGSSPEQLRNLIGGHLDLIPNRSKDDDTCELVSSLTPEMLMRLQAPVGVPGNGLSSRIVG